MKQSWSKRKQRKLKEHDFKNKLDRKQSNKKVREDARQQVTIGLDEHYGDIDRGYDEFLSEFFNELYDG